MSSLVCTDLTFAWPDGTAVLDGLDLAVGPGRTGLIGANGSGKSTLLDLVAGRLRPLRGSVTVDGDLGYLPQNLSLHTGRTVDDVLGIAEVRAALDAIEAGDVSEVHFAAVDDNWDVEERARATLDRLGLGHLGLGRTVGSLSGGESMLVGIAAQFLREPDVLLLDEPTNDLDLDARHRLYDAVTTWNGAIVVVSHDRALLDLVDRVVELADGAARTYGGNLTAYEAAVAAEREAAERAVRSAETDVRRQRRVLIEARTKLARRERYGRKMEAQKREPKIVMGQRKRQAQAAAGKHLDTHLGSLAGARSRLAEAEEAVRDDNEIRVDLPETAVPAGRTVLACHRLPVLDTEVDLDIRGPERIALLGRNGAGKTTLLRLLSAEPAPQLLLLDEPTNNLDMTSVRQLEQALRAYRGALVVASHDLPFLRSVEVTRWLRLDRTGLAEI